MRQDPNKTPFDARRQADELWGFHDAIWQGNTEVVREYLDEYGLNIYNALSERKNYYKPLLMAAAAGQNAVISLLLDAGVPIEEKSGTHGDTPLQEAIRKKNISTVTLLLDRGAAIEGTDGAGFTPLMLAVIYNRVENAHILLERGANAAPKPLLLKDNSARGRLKRAFNYVTRRQEAPIYSRTMMEIASRNASVEMARLLMQYGASTNDIPASPEKEAFLLKLNAQPAPPKDAPKP